MVTDGTQGADCYLLLKWWHLFSKNLIVWKKCSYKIANIIFFVYNLVGSYDFVLDVYCKNPKALGAVYEFLVLPINRLIIGLCSL